MNRFMARIVSVAALFAAPALAHPDHQPTPPGKPAESDLLAQGAIEFLPGPAALEVKKARTGHLLVRPRVNGHDAGWYIFDSGAGVCCITTGVAADLGLTRTGDIQASGVGGGKSAPMYRARELRLGPVALKDHPLMEMDFGFLDAHMGEHISGVIGFGVFSRCVAEIDIEKPSITLHNPASYALPRGQWIKADLDKRVPAIEASYEGRTGRFRLDTGDHTTVTFHAPATKNYDLLKGRDTTDIQLGGVGGFVNGKRGTLASLEIAGEKLENLPASFALEGKGTLAEPETDGNIGTGVLGRFVMVFDYTNNRMAFMKRE